MKSRFTTSEALVFFAIAAVAILGPLVSHASLHQNGPTAALPFFSSPQSAFPSGSRSLEDLAKNEIPGSGPSGIEVAGPQGSFLLQADQVVTASDFAHRKRPSLLILGNTSLRLGPGWKSPSVLQLPPRTWLPMLQLQGDWARVEFAGATGWVSISDAVLEADLAQSIPSSKANEPEKKIRYRQGDHLLTTEGQRIALTMDLPLRLRPDLAIVVDPKNESRLHLRNHLRITGRDKSPWRRSQLRGHGLVYWRDTFTEGQVSVLASEELLKREITSAAFFRDQDYPALATSSGVWLSKDGRQWMRLGAFSEDETALAIGPNRELLVGNWLSLSSGQDFEPVFRWEQMAARLREESGGDPATLRIAGAKFIHASKVGFELESASHSFEITINLKKNSPKNWQVSGRKKGQHLSAHRFGQASSVLQLQTRNRMPGQVTKTHSRTPSPSHGEPVALGPNSTSPTNHQRR